jgi:hypothetical protein
MRSLFVMICVDQRSNALPEFVTCVPLIYNQTNRQVYTDDRIDQILASHMQQQQETMDHLIPYSELGIGKYSDVFSYLDEHVDTTSQAYDWIEKPVEPAHMMPMSSSSGNEVKGKSKLDPKLLESFMSQRDMDLEQIKRGQPRTM